MKERDPGATSIAKPSMPLFLPLLLLFSLLNSPFCCAQGNLTSDALALLAFKNQLTLGSSRTITQLASWNTSSIATVCTSWFNVICSSSSSSANQSRVSELHLPGRTLLGPIAPNTVGRLDALHTLSLRSNRLSGSLPLDLANLSALRKLYLQGNNLSGSLPSSFSAWPLLSQLDVSSNSFSGSIPTSLNSLTHLKSLNLHDNLLNGTIPSLDIASLAAFNVSNNNLSGPVPETLAARFNSSSFAGNVNLCGPPLEACSSRSLSPQASRSKSNKLSKGAIVGIVCGAAAAAALLLLLLCICLLKKRKGRHAVGNGTREVDTRRTVSTGVVAPAEEAKREASANLGKEGEDQRTKLEFVDNKKLFDLEDLLRASAEVLGKGTLGTSYKAVLEDGLIVTVKRLRDVDESGRDEIREGIRGVGRLKHENLVPLRAYYLDKEENLLVYDFMQNGSLSALLHGSKEEGYASLDWEARMKIAATSVQGLAFLHAHDMVHGNIKSTNVLLKSNLNACLTDYCLSPILGFTPSAPNKPFGYLAPEITDPRRLTPKADVFSFGVLLLELLTGKVPVAPSPSAPSSANPSSFPSSSSVLAPSPSPSAARFDDSVDLPRWVQSVVREEWTAEVFDPSLIHSGQPFNEEEMVQLLQIAMPCVSPSPDQRPTMADVVRMINNIRRTTDDDKSSDSYPEQYLTSASENQ